MYILAALIVILSVSAVEFDYVVGSVNDTQIKWKVKNLIRQTPFGPEYDFRPSHTLNFPTNVFFDSTGPYRLYAPDVTGCRDRGFYVQVLNNTQEVFIDMNTFYKYKYGWRTHSEINPLDVFGNKIKFYDYTAFCWTLRRAGTSCRDSDDQHKMCDHRFDFTLSLLQDFSKGYGFVSIFDKSKRFPGPFDLFTPIPFTEYGVASTNSDVKVGFAPVFSKTTTDGSAEVMACVDADHDDNCDYFAEDNCANYPNRPGDFFQGSCCGVGAYASCKYDSGKKAFCGPNTTNFWHWAALEEPGVIGDLSDPTCISGMLVSEGSKFYYCGTNFQKAKGMYSEVYELIDKVNIAGHDYLCRNNKIIECGGTSPRSRTALTAGESFVIAGETNFCNADGSFSTDIIDEIACTIAGFNWSGSKCCGEPNTKNKNYEDSLGGCLNNIFIPAGSTVQGNDDIINDKGVFVVCNPSSNNDVPAPGSHSFFTNKNITPLVKGSCGSPLLNADLQNNNAVCLPSSSWLLTPSPENTVVKQTAWSATQDSGCCPVDDCWNGNSCTVNNDYFKVGSQGFKCEAGSWMPAALKFSWDKSSSGFCSAPTQCLVNDAYDDSLDGQPDLYFDNLGSPNMLPKCINDTQYIFDSFCDTGLWSSRTNLIAQQLLAIAVTNSPNDFSLYCDSFDNSLNVFDYIVSSVSVLPLLSDSCMIGNLVNQPCVNNFCVLEYGNNVAFGVSLNKPVDAADSFLRALDKSRTYCNGERNNDGFFTKCGDNIWYNHDIESIISTSELSLPIITPTINSFFNNNFEDISNFVFSDVHSTSLPQFDYSFFNTSLPLFDFVYFSQKNTKSIFGFKEKTSFIDFTGWNFNNVNLPSNFCLFIKTLGGECESKNSNVFIVGKKEGFQESIVDHWSDLSGKLRLV